MGSDIAKEGHNTSFILHAGILCGRFLVVIRNPTVILWCQMISVIHLVQYSSHFCES